ncbi:sucrase ferredoxin [Streptomyces sp. SID11385]|uniref:sucrase ferredoxin n=1 Tax=Streptomyces sp. SID11385 TaxID=2706031 RepID=UPI0013C5ED03|nr:sucrase ferredoxin [Streptomyces sp. SID11385]NEA40189.1 sucrase ferredoxin [Streptomyces sp. SID11385]
MAENLARFFCAEAARARGDSLAGTAPHGRVWVLIEHPGGWPPNGFEGAGLEPAVADRVFAAARARRARLLLVRRPGRRRAGPRRWAVLHHDARGAHRQTWGTWQTDADLDGVVDALHGPGTTGHPPVVLVCAHGTHDVCCAVRGRPVAAALGARHPDLVWECTHLGGDRFAANVAVLPDGVYYGNLDAPSAVTTLADHLAGHVGARHLRGYTDLPPPAQVAVAALLARHGPANRQAYEIVGTERADGGWRVRVAGAPPHPELSEVEVRAHRTAPHRLTCRGATPSAFLAHEAVAVRTLRGPATTPHPG